MTAPAQLAPLLLRLSKLSPAVILIDGRSGSGKTALAIALRDHLGGDVLHLDDLYPGWGGLSEGSRAAAQALADGRFSRFDWHTMAYAETVTLSRQGCLIVEGCGAITTTNVRAARQRSRGARVHTIWLECADAVRRTRALARDGDVYRPYWAAWQAQEDAHIELEQPFALAAEVIHCR